MKRHSRPSFFIFHFSFFILIAALARGADIPLSSFQPAGYFDTAAVIQSGLRNTEDTDAVYVAPLFLDTGGTILRIAVELELSPSNSVTCAFGTPHDPDILRIINEDGRFSILTGDTVRPFDTPLPPPLTGTHTYKLALVMDMTAGLFTTTVKVYEDGVQIPSPSLSIVNYQLSILPPPSAWTLATVNLRGKAILKTLRCSLDFPASVIILR